MPAGWWSTRPVPTPTASTRATRQGRPLAVDAGTGESSDRPRPIARPRLGGVATLPDGRRARTVFALLAERYRDARYAPEAVSGRCGVPAETIRRIAAEIGHIAFERPITIEQPWTDTRGVRHAGFLGRPVAMHAMRGISAHSNGFQTCRALHLLQLLIGSVDVPGGWRYKAPYPRPCPPGPRPSGRPEEIRPGKPLPGSPLGFPRGPEDLLLEADGRPVRIDKAFSWDAPLAVHGMLQTVIANAWRGDPYPVEVLFLYMANMAWNSAMNPGETMRMLADKDPATGDYRIPHFIYVDAYHSETVAYADLVLPDTTYLERWDCISLLDRPIGTAHGPGDAIRQPVVAPDRDVRPFQEVLIDLGVRLRLPAFAHPDGEPRYPGGYPDYLVHHQRKPGIGPLAGWRGAKGDEHGRGAPNDRQLEAYVANGCFWHFELRARGELPQAGQPRLSRPSARTGPARHRGTDHAPPLCRDAAALPARGRRAWAGAAAGQPSRAHPHPLRPAAVLVPAVRAGGVRRRRISAARDHPAADADVPQLGLAECLAAPDPGPQLPLHEPAHRRRAGPRRRRLGRDHEPARAHPGPAPPDGRLRREHRLDLERDRQARRRLGPGAGCARGRARLPAQPRHRRAAARGAEATATPTPTRSPVRRRGSTCGSESASSAEPARRRSSPAFPAIGRRRA